MGENDKESPKFDVPASDPRHPDNATSLEDFLTTGLGCLVAIGVVAVVIFLGGGLLLYLWRLAGEGWATLK